MIARVHSFVLRGIEAQACEVEVDLSPTGMPKTTIVGLPDAAVKESMERVRTALENSGYRYPTKRLTVNLAPAHIRKEGPVYDLPIALAILLADGTIVPPDDPDRGVDRLLVAGELALDGRVRMIRGGVSLALFAQRRGMRGIIVPSSNAPEAAAVGGLAVYGVRTLADVVRFLNGEWVLAPHAAVDTERLLARAKAEIDFGDVRGQEAAKRGLVVAAAGGHNALLLGPPGTGKTMMAKALPGVLPPLTRTEALEVTCIYSSIGAVPDDVPLILRRPVRAPHHTASSAAVIGGGSIPRPGDVSLAHHGILFLDELPEFNRAVLETLRQPLEDGAVTIARSHGSVRFPADFMLLAALNPTASGGAADDGASRQAMDRYLGRLSGPLIDRIDLHIEVPAVPFEMLTGDRRGTDTATMAVAVREARRLQLARSAGRLNARLGGRELDAVVDLSSSGIRLLERAMTDLGLSARAFDRIRRVARTIADLTGAETVSDEHLAEAIQYRRLDRRLGATSAR